VCVEAKTAYIGLGSNLGDRVEALGTAVDELRALKNSHLTAVSGLYETSPVKAQGGTFLNAVAVIETGLEPAELLKTLLNLEKAMGRPPKHDRGGPRRIDLDILLYGNTCIEEAELILPHPRMLRRRFVMEPLAELAPNLSIPPTGITALEAAARLAKNHPEQEIERLGTMQEVKESLRFDV